MTLFNVWKDTAAKYGLPVFFNLGVVEDFTKILGRTVFVITTSIKEGFGFSFVEPWTIGKEVRGRYLDAVCPDFEAKGITFPRMYRSVKIPQELFDIEGFRSRWNLGVGIWAGQFDLKIDASRIDESFTGRFINTLPDFAHLDETAQIEVIHAGSKSPENKNRILEVNPWLNDFFTTPPATSGSTILEKNRKIIHEDFGPDTYRQNLLNIYTKIQHHVPHGLEKKKVLDAFLHIDNYMPLGS